MHAERTWADAEQKLASGELEVAARLYGKLRGDARFGALAALRLSLIASRHGDFRTAVGDALDACRRSGPDPTLLELVAKRLLSLGEKRAALDVVERILQLPGVPVSALAELGKMLSDGDEPVAALRLLRRAEAGGLSSAALHYLIGLSEMYAGDSDQARAHLDASLAADPMFAPAHWALVKLGKQDGSGAHRDRLRDALARLDEAHPDRPLLLYSLFHRLDAEGEVADAWEALDRGMKARRRQVRYDALAEARLMGLLESAEALPDSQPLAGPTPIFIVGLPRTGTTLLDQLLGRHPDVARAGELRDFNWCLRHAANQGGAPLLDERLVASLAGSAVEGLGGRYLARTQWRAEGRRFFTDKLPPNFMNIGWIAGSLPQARIIHITRNPMDACFSNLKELFAAPYPYSYDQQEMVGHYTRYRRLMGAWRDRFPERILEVSYEELVRRPEEVLAAIQAGCGLAERAAATGPAAVEVVATASAMQVRAPLHQRGVGAWRSYADRLAPLQHALEAEGLL